MRSSRSYMSCSYAVKLLCYSEKDVDMFYCAFTFSICYFYLTRHMSPASIFTFALLLTLNPFTRLTYA